MGRGTSITDVAAAAGVSVTTVSHALSGRRAVAATTKRRILDAVAELDYRPNLSAQSLRSNRTRSVALVVADIANPYYPSLAKAVHDRLEPEGYVMLICDTNGDAATEERLLRDMVARGVDGIILTITALGSEKIREIVGPELPLVGGGIESDDPNADEVGSEDAVGIRQAVEHLVAAGIDDIGFATGPAGELPSAVRLGAFRGACDDLGLAVRDDRITSVPFTRDGGLAAGASLLADGDDRPGAIMCGNDLIAIGVIDAARSLGLAVPGDLRVIGFDDIETASLVSPQLTTVENPARRTGNVCADAVLRRIEGGAGPHARIGIPTRLIVRESA